MKRLEELYAGIRLACDIYGVDLVGGDTSASRTGLTISITCVGEGEKGKLPEKIRCYLLENGEKAILVPEREFSENAWMF